MTIWVPVCCLLLLACTACRAEEHNGADQAGEAGGHRLRGVQPQHASSAEHRLLKAANDTLATNTTQSQGAIASDGRSNAGGNGHKQAGSVNSTTTCTSWNSAGASGTFAANATTNCTVDPLTTNTTLTNSTTTQTNSTAPTNSTAVPQSQQQQQAACARDGVTAASVSGDCGKHRVPPYTLTATASATAVTSADGGGAAAAAGWRSAAALGGAGLDEVAVAASAIAVVLHVPFDMGVDDSAGSLELNSGGSSHTVAELEASVRSSLEAAAGSGGGVSVSVSVQVSGYRVSIPIGLQDFSAVPDCGAESLALLRSLAAAASLPGGAALLGVSCAFAAVDASASATGSGARRRSLMATTTATGTSTASTCAPRISVPVTLDSSSTASAIPTTTSAPDLDTLLSASVAALSSSYSGSAGAVCPLDPASPAIEVVSKLSVNGMRGVSNSGAKTPSARPSLFGTDSPGAGLEAAFLSIVPDAYTIGTNDNSRTSHTEGVSRRTARSSGALLGAVLCARVSYPGCTPDLDDDGDEGAHASEDEEMQSASASDSDNGSDPAAEAMEVEVQVDDEGEGAMRAAGDPAERLFTRGSYGAQQGAAAGGPSRTASVASASAAGSSGSAASQRVWICAPPLPPAAATVAFILPGAGDAVQATTAAELAAAAAGCDKDRDLLRVQSRRPGFVDRSEGGCLAAAVASSVCSAAAAASGFSHQGSGADTDGAAAAYRLEDLDDCGGGVSAASSGGATAASQRRHSALNAAAQEVLLPAGEVQPAVAAGAIAAFGDGVVCAADFVLTERRPAPVPASRRKTWDDEEEDMGPSATRLAGLTHDGTSAASSAASSMNGRGGLVDAGVNANAEGGTARLAALRRLAVGPSRPAWGLVHVWDAQSAS
eukprot:XP_001696291.1 predicted protein [Chlamydomonas reinhardtii]